MENNNSHIRAKQLRNPYILGGIYAFVVLIVLVSTLLSSQSVGNLVADDSEVDGVDVAIENGYSYAFGTPASDNLDDQVFRIESLDPELEARFYDVINTSPAYAWVDSIQDLLDYEDFDSQGNIKIERALEIIGIGEYALEEQE